MHSNLVRWIALCGHWAHSQKRARSSLLAASLPRRPQASPINNPSIQHATYSHKRFHTSCLASSPLPRPCKSLYKHHHHMPTHATCIPINNLSSRHDTHLQHSTPPASPRPCYSISEQPFIPTRRILTHTILCLPSRLDPAAASSSSGQEGKHRTAHVSTRKVSAGQHTSGQGSKHSQHHTGGESVKHYPPLRSP